MMAQAVLGRRDASAPAPAVQLGAETSMLSMSNSWQNLAAERLLHALRPDLDLMATEMPSLGSAALLEVLLPGALATTTATITKAAVAAAAVEAEVEAEAEAEEPLAVLHPGLATDGNATMITMVAIPIMAGRTTATEGLPPPVQRPGSNPLERRLHTGAMLVATLVATLVALWGRLRVLVDHLELPASVHLLHLLLIT